MAIHQEISRLAEEAISEYLSAADCCIKFKKEDGGCLGYPAALLLLCAVNAIGVFHVGESVLVDGRLEHISKSAPFRVFNHPDFGLCLTAPQIKTIEKQYRNLLAHNGVIAPEHCLLELIPACDVPAFFFFEGGAAIEVGALLALVGRAWSRLDKRKIGEAVRAGRIPIPQSTKPAKVSASVATPISASGAIFSEKKQPSRRR